jgi:superfamily II DNA or RNA helicase
MKPQRRPYQSKVISETYEAWNNGHRNTLMVMPTGAGKTKTFASMLDDIQGQVTLIAHRKELVGQISTAVAEFEQYHNLIAAEGTVKNCIRRHVEVLGKSFYDRRSRVTVASIDTILAKHDTLAQWGSQQSAWVIDEAHHVLQNNKWGKGLALFPNAFGLGVTATPLRADRKSLARSQGGVFDTMVIGPSMREMIDGGYLCDYIVYAPPSSLDAGNLKVGASGDYTSDSVRKEAHRSQIVGDIVQHYQKFTPSKRTIVFAVDVEQADELAARFNSAGFRAASVDGNTPETIRDQTISKFSRGLLDVLVNVDLFGEGFDVPAVEVIIMGRPTMSYGLFAQQFGRMLRPLDGKPYGILVDCVGNVQFHGLPDAPRKWSLLNDNTGKKRDRDPDAIPIRSCMNPDVTCYKAYPATMRGCPYCGYAPPPAGRSLPEQVDGDLMLLDAATLAQMRGAVARIDGQPAVPVHLLGTPAETAIIRNWHERQGAQEDLRSAIAQWAGIWKERGKEDSEIHRRFYFRFGTDILSAQNLGKKDANELLEIIGSVSADLIAEQQARSRF